MLTLAASACSPPPDSATDAYRGVSETIPTGSAAISDSGLVAAYDMETTTPDGRLQDFSGNGHHADLDDHRLTDGPVGRAQRFNAVADRVHLPEHAAFDLDGPLTVAVWVRVDSLNLHQHIVACDDKWALWVTPDNRYRLGDTRGGGWSTTADRVERGAWASVVAVLRGTAGDPLTDETAAIYVDGEPASAFAHLRSEEAQARGTWNPGALYPDDACYIGFESHQGEPRHRQMPFAGAIDNVLVFARAWTVEEIRAFATRPGETAVTQRP
jgi:hypothetical protein